jgi:RNA polymerase sigma-70 factor (ECF subfamily)
LGRSPAKSRSAEDRNVLRYHFAHGLTIDQIGALYHVHRATAARRVAKARDELLAGTRRRLMARLALNRADLDSVMRLIESSIHVSLRRVLG